MVPIGEGGMEAWLGESCREATGVPRPLATGGPAVLNGSRGAGRTCSVGHCEPNCIELAGDGGSVGGSDASMTLLDCPPQQPTPAVGTPKGRT